MLEKQCIYLESNRINTKKVKHATYVITEELALVAVYSSHFTMTNHRLAPACGGLDRQLTELCPGCDTAASDWIGLCRVFSPLPITV